MNKKFVKILELLGARLEVCVSVFVTLNTPLVMVGDKNGKNSHMIKDPTKFVLTLRAPPIYCSKRQFPILPLFQK